MHNDLTWYLGNQAPQNAALWTHSLEEIEEVASIKELSQQSPATLARMVHKWVSGASQFREYAQTL